MDLFYIVVLSVAVLFLILTLTSFGVMLKKSKSVKAYPQNSPYCPDYWDVVPSVSSDGVLSYKCRVPDDMVSKIDSLKKYAKNTKNINNSVATDSSGRTYIDFFTNDMWSGNTGVCNKYSWATTNNAGTVNWDGITNVNNANLC